MRDLRVPLVKAPASIGRRIGMGDQVQYFEALAYQTPLQDGQVSNSCFHAGIEEILI